MEELEPEVEDIRDEIDQRQDAGWRRLLDIPGVGTLVVSALVATVGDGSASRKDESLLHGWGWYPENTLIGGSQR